MNSFNCPHCGKKIELSDALRHQVSEEFSNELRDKLTKEFSEKSSLEIADLKKRISEGDQKVTELREQELKLREDRRKLEDTEKELKLNIQRQIDQEKAKIVEEISKKSADEHRLKDLENEKRIGDLQKQLEETLRKTKVGSQQLQGEILELDLEDTLRSTFTNDEINPIGKGVRGADVKQVVKSPKGFVCGVILWEAKRTKNWTDSWTEKLKEDLRGEKANIAVIVSQALPDEAKSGFGIKDGVWVVDYSLVLPIATLLRKNLLDVGFQKVVAEHKGEKAEVLYEYVTSHEFAQQLEALVEVYNEMQSQIIRERAAFEKIWKAREGQISRLLTSTSNVVGSIQGRVGQSALPVKGLELDELESGN